MSSRLDPASFFASADEMLEPYGLDRRTFGQNLCAIRDTPEGGIVIYLFAAESDDGDVRNHVSDLPEFLSWESGIKWYGQAAGAPGVFVRATQKIMLDTLPEAWMKTKAAR